MLCNNSESVNFSISQLVLRNVSCDVGDEDSVAAGLARQTKWGKIHARVSILFFFCFFFYLFRVV